VVGDRGIDIATNLRSVSKLNLRFKIDEVESRVLTEKIAAYVIGEGHRQGHLEWLRGLQCDMR